jgi:hypothetical protein
MVNISITYINTYIIYIHKHRHRHKHKHKHKYIHNIHRHIHRHRHIHIIEIVLVIDRVNIKRIVYIIKSKRKTMGNSSPPPTISQISLQNGLVFVHKLKHPTLSNISIYSKKERFYFMLVKV